VRVSDVRCTEGDSPFGVSIDYVIEKQIMHVYSLSGSWLTDWNAANPAENRPDTENVKGWRTGKLRRCPG
jgi:hypothetical protein